MANIQFMDKDILADEILKTLSFMEPMTLEHIFLDLDKEFLLDHNQLNYQDLLNTLEALRRARKIKVLKVKKQSSWIKVFPKRPWYRRLLNLIR